MLYEIGGKIKSKKPHACGGDEWQIIRTGADVKLKCLKCGKALFCSLDQTKKMTKQYFPTGEVEEKNV